MNIFYQVISTISSFRSIENKYDTDVKIYEKVLWILKRSHNKNN